jgi:hypothetical protein
MQTALTFALSSEDIMSVDASHTLCMLMFLFRTSALIDSISPNIRELKSLRTLLMHSFRPRPMIQQAIDGFFDKKEGRCSCPK